MRKNKYTWYQNKTKTKEQINTSFRNKKEVNRKVFADLLPLLHIITALYFLYNLFSCIFCWGKGGSLNLVNLLSMLFTYFVIRSGGHLAGSHGGGSIHANRLSHSLLRFSEGVTQNMLCCAICCAGCWQAENRRRQLKPTHTSAGSAGVNKRLWWKLNGPLHLC